MNLLDVRNLKVDFHLQEGVVQAVRGVSFRIRPGATVALVGESGSGKSVISQAVLGILPRAARITGGDILFRDPDADGDGGPVNIARLARNGRTIRSLRGGRISIIFQEPMTSLSPLHTIGNQIAEAVRLHRNTSPVEARRLSAEMLRQVEFPNPEAALDLYPFELSGGLRQRAMIAMALVCRPALLIADEPTTALDVTIQAQILKLLRELQANLGMAVLMITHDLGVVANVAEEVVVLYRGEVMESGTVTDLFAQPRHPYLKALMQAVPRFSMAPGERLVPLREIKPQGAGMLAATGAAEASAGPLVEVRAISKRFGVRKGGLLGGNASGGVLAVDDVSFDVMRGECLGLVGESGCGKTTLSKVLMRALAPDAGSLHFNDRDRRLDLLTLSGPALTRFRQRQQFIFQDPYGSLNPRMTVFDIISEPLVIHGIGERAHRRALVQELMGLVGLDARHLNRYPHSFSGGQRQRIGIARALALRPDFVICDEPVSALDVSIQAQILNLLRDLKGQLGLTYLFISHNLAVVDYIADRIMVMCRGRIVEMAPSQTLFRNPVHPYTQALLAAVPEPDLARPLDFAKIRETRSSDPAYWPAPFTIDCQARLPMIDLGGGHSVRAAHKPKELAS